MAIVTVTSLAGAAFVNRLGILLAQHVFSLPMALSGRSSTNSTRFGSLNLQCALRAHGRDYRSIRIKAFHHDCVTPSPKSGCGQPITALPHDGKALDLALNRLRIESEADGDDQALPGRRWKVTARVILPMAQVMKPVRAKFALSFPASAIAGNTFGPSPRCRRLALRQYLTSLVGDAQLTPGTEPTLPRCGRHQGVRVFMPVRQAVALEMAWPVRTANSWWVSASNGAEPEMKSRMWPQAARVSPGACKSRV